MDSFLKNPIVIFLVIAIPLIGFLYRSYNDPKDFPKPAISFHAFDCAKISGHIGHLTTTGHGDYFSLKEDPSTFYFATLIDVIPKYDKYGFTIHGLIFSADIGDSITKDHFSDTLVLVKNNVNTYYTILRPIQ